MWLRISESLNKVRQKADEGAGVAFTALSRARDALLNLGGIGDEFAAAYEGCSAEELAKLLPRQALSVQTPEELHRTVHVWLTLLEHSDAPDSMRFHSRDLDLARERDGILESEEESAAGGEPAAAKSAPAVSAFAEKLQEELRLLKDLRLPPELLGLHFGFAEVFLSSSALPQLLVGLSRSQRLRTVLQAAWIRLETRSKPAVSEEVSAAATDGDEGVSSTDRSENRENRENGAGSELEDLLRELLRLLELALVLRRPQALAFLKALVQTAASDEEAAREDRDAARPEALSSETPEEEGLLEHSEGTAPSEEKDKEKEKEPSASQESLSPKTNRGGVFRKFGEEIALSFRALMRSAVSLQRPWPLWRLEAQVERLQAETASLSRKIEGWPLPVADESDAEESVVAQNLRLRASTRLLQQQRLLRTLHERVETLRRQTAEAVAKEAEEWRKQRIQRSADWELHQQKAEAVVQEAQQELQASSKDLAEQALLLEQRRSDVSNKLKAKEAEREQLEAKLEECLCEIRPFAQIDALRKSEASVHVAEERLHLRLLKSQAEGRRRQERHSRSVALWRDTRESLSFAESALEEAALEHKQQTLGADAIEASASQAQLLEKNFQTLVYRHYAFEKTRMQQQAAALLQRMRILEKEAQNSELASDEVKGLQECFVKGIRRFKAAHAEAEAFLRMYTPALQAAIRQQLLQVKQKQQHQEPSNDSTEIASSEAELKQIEEADEAAQTPQREITSLYNRTIQKLAPLLSSLEQSFPPPLSPSPPNTSLFHSSLQSQQLPPSTEGGQKTEHGARPVSAEKAVSEEAARQEAGDPGEEKRLLEAPLVFSIDEESCPPSPKVEHEDSPQEAPGNASAKVLDDWYEGDSH